MKPSKLAFLAAVAVLAMVAAVAVAASSYSVVDMSTRSTQNADSVGVVKILSGEVSGALPATATVTVSRVYGSVTTAVFVVACTAGKGATTAVANSYLVRGDKLVRSGTSNNPSVRLIVEGE